MLFVDRTNGAVTGVFACPQREDHEELAEDHVDMLDFRFREGKAAKVIAAIREYNRRLGPFADGDIVTARQRVAALKAEILATTTPAELDAIDITVGWN